MLKSLCILFSKIGDILLLMVFNLIKFYGAVKHRALKLTYTVGPTVGGPLHWVGNQPKFGRPFRYSATRNI